MEAAQRQWHLEKLYYKIRTKFQEGARLVPTDIGFESNVPKT